MVMRVPFRPFIPVTLTRFTRELAEPVLKDTIASTRKNDKHFGRIGRVITSVDTVRFVQTAFRISFPRAASESKEKPSSNLRNRKVIPESDPPSIKDINHLYQFFDRSSKLVVLTGAGISTECGIPDYRSPNGAYSTGFKPITHQEFMRSVRARRRYWARSFAGWRKFSASQPGAAHIALASLEKAGRINLMITQNVDRLHHRAGSNPLELHGTVYIVACTDCGFSISRSAFQDQVKNLNEKLNARWNL